MRAPALWMAMGLSLALPANAATETHCREFSTTIIIDGKQQLAYGTACLQPDNSWRIVGDLDTEVSPETPSIVENPPSAVYPYPYPYAWGEPFFFSGSFLFIDRFGHRHHFERFAHRRFLDHRFAHGGVMMFHRGGFGHRS